MIEGIALNPGSLAFGTTTVATIGLAGTGLGLLVAVTIWVGWFFCIDKHCWHRRNARSPYFAPGMTTSNFRLYKIFFLV